ncbi:MAG: DUF3644 domain-containing protein [Solirubrobacteraceae bacterium]
MAPRPKWWHTLQGSRREALLAVDLYNRAASERSLEGFVMHMHVAWLYLHHAKFLRDGTDYRYREDNGHFERVDGEIKTWDLARCLREAFPSQPSAVRANVEFFVKIRNKSAWAAAHQGTMKCLRRSAGRGSRLDIGAQLNPQQVWRRAAGPRIVATSTNPRFGSHQGPSPAGRSSTPSGRRQQCSRSMIESPAWTCIATALSRASATLAPEAA